MLLKRTLLSACCLLASFTYTIWAQPKTSEGTSPIEGEWKGILIIAVVAWLVFLIIREFWCWFWKINAVLETLRGIRGCFNSIDTSLDGIRSDISNRPEPDTLSEIASTLESIRAGMTNERADY
jgi:hypothetical protein